MNRHFLVAVITSPDGLIPSSRGHRSARLWTRVANSLTTCPAMMYCYFIAEIYFTNWTNGYVLIGYPIFGSRRVFYPFEWIVYRRDNRSNGGLQHFAHLSCGHLWIQWIRRPLAFVEADIAHSDGLVAPTAFWHWTAFGGTILAKSSATRTTVMFMIERFEFFVT